MTAHAIPVGAKVRVRFQTGHFNDRFYRAGWRVATVTGHSTVGQGATPTYDVTLRDGNVITHCSSECVKAAP